MTQQFPPPPPGPYGGPQADPQWLPPNAAPPQAPKKKRKWPWIIGAAVLLFVVVGVASSGSKTPTGAASSSDPGFGTATAPSWTAPQVIKPSYAATPGAMAPVHTAEPSPAKRITAREWQTIAKDPASHTGERVVVYGQVTQFDAATGTEGFRANVDGIEHKPKYGFADYKTNTILASDEATLKDVVQDDLFKAEVTVVGAQQYQTTLGGTLTAPMLRVTRIEVIGHV
jgi:hypothetical protein